MKYVKRKKIPEAIIQAEFYQACKRARIKCDLSYVVDESRFDAVIVRGGMIVCIVEIKSYVDDRRGSRGTDQIRRYRRYGVPICIITHLAQIPKATKLIKASQWRDKFFVQPKGIAVYYKQRYRNLDKQLAADLQELYGPNWKRILPAGLPKEKLISYVRRARGQFSSRE